MSPRQVRPDTSLDVLTGWLVTLVKLVPNIRNFTYIQRKTEKIEKVMAPKMKTITLILGSILIGLVGCVSTGKITLKQALTDVVDSMAAMEQEEKSQATNGFTKMGTYVKEVDVTFNVSASGDISESADLSSIPVGAAKAGLKVAGDYKSSKGNTITLKFTSLLDNDAFTSNKVKFSNGQILVRGPSASAGQAKPTASANPSASASQTPKSEGGPNNGNWSGTGPGGGTYLLPFKEFSTRGQKIFKQNGADEDGRISKDDLKRAEQELPTEDKQKLQDLGLKESQ